ncbi:Formate acetyltransferase 1 [Sinobacterium norvegicum]|uniref:Formate acetyltransferase n=1 Tax=Sinobacterium norvegicum TaxID=1641715 RepID=A0ABM9A9R2_9GAMM|nr:formate C-acetyltransferase [Sinobacterium norvegicum]CAH0989947.1 Formate acetyltransferase 1 [Sinobacterium norvegicum]
MNAAIKILKSEWAGFNAGDWCGAVNVRDFIQQNYTPYLGNDQFLAPATHATNALWQTVQQGIRQENETHAPVDFDTEKVSTITSHAAGYIDAELEKIVGLQTEAPLKRGMMPNGGVRMVESSAAAYGRTIDPVVSEVYSKFRKTHNQGVFDMYTPEIRACRSSGVLTGLPDAYGRGRIIGDYRRIALYGVDLLIEEKRRELADSDTASLTQELMKTREQLNEQMRSLVELVEMASTYGCDIARPANSAQEAIQWTYMGYLAAIKSQNGAAMSLGRVSSFLDIFIERDLLAGVISEQQAQEMVDHFIMKLRMVRFLRTPEYDELFSGDPIWATESVAGMSLDGRTLVTKNSFRFLHSLYNMGPSPEPNITVLWAEGLPEGFKKFCAKVSIDSSSIQYENDDLMREDFGSDDYAIACCVSPMIIGKQMQYFGARANLAKTMLYAINGGVDEMSGKQVAPKADAVTSEYLDYAEVDQRLDSMMDWLAKTYVNALNCIHFSHDKYAYEAVQMALHDRDIHRTMACGIAGLSIAADSLSAMKFAKVKAIRDDNGLAVDYQVEGDFPKFGNDDARVDDIACELVERFMAKIRSNHIYNNAEPTQSILTITSNVVYGKKTGNTPDGRRAGEPFAPGANPMHGRDVEGAISSLSSESKLPYSSAKDGISYTFSMIPESLGKTEQGRIDNLVGLLDGYFHHTAEREGGQHINVNVLDRDTLVHAMDHPEEYPSLTIRVSGYAIRFNSLTREQQLEVISRTFTSKM